MPFISVIMSVYNDETNIRKSVESILNQTFRDFEFIITDDCSKDNSLTILREYAKKDNRIVLVVNKENLKLTKNLNNMLDIAKGDLIARMDSDDISFPDRFEKQVNIFINDPAVDFVFTGTIFIDKDGNELCKSWRPEKVDSILTKMKFKNFIPHPTILAKKELFFKAGKYTELNGYGQEDKELWEKLISLKAAFYYVKQPLLYYRLNPKGVSYTVSSQGYSYSYKLICYCVDNYANFRAIALLRKYLNHLSFIEIILIIFKILIPLKLRLLRIELIYFIRSYFRKK